MWMHPGCIASVHPSIQPSTYQLIHLFIIPNLVLHFTGILVFATFLQSTIAMVETVLLTYLDQKWQNPQQVSQEKRSFFMNPFRKVHAIKTGNLELGAEELPEVEEVNQMEHGKIMNIVKNERKHALNLKFVDRAFFVINGIVFVLVLIICVSEFTRPENVKRRLLIPDN